MTIDLCVVNFNTYTKLMRLCSELEKSNLYTLRIADNGSLDNSVQMLKSSPPLNAEEILFNENIGYATACNQLAARGTGEIIGLLNSDVWMKLEDVQHIIKAFEDSEVAVLGPKQVNERGHITHAGISGDETSAAPRAWKVPDPSDRKFKNLEEMVSVSGSAYFIRRSVWEELTNCPLYQDIPIVKSNSIKGAFLPTLHYYEETFCSYHARSHGHKVFYDGRICIGHSWHASHSVGSKYDKLFHKSRELFRSACDAHGIPHD